MTLRLSFYGAAGQVTGSMYLLEAAGARILLDAGLFQGRRAEARKLNAELPFDARRIDMVVVSHAHIDHTGRLPLLVKNGFHGPIYCTPATRDLSAVMLPDAAYIQEKDAEFLSRHHRGGPESEPLYNLADAAAVQDLMVGLPYRRPLHLRKMLTAEFTDAGHILGSATVDLRCTEGVPQRIVFSGDIGRSGLPIIRDPQPPSGPIDTLIVEATYADRDHESVAEAERRLGEVVRRVAARGGKVLIPSFAVGRVQELVYALHQLWRRGELPEIPVYVDSPLAVSATEVFRLHPDVFDHREQLIANGFSPFDFPLVRYVRDVADSMKLNTLARPGGVHRRIGHGGVGADPASPGQSRGRPPELRALRRVPGGAHPGPAHPGAAGDGEDLRRDARAPRRGGIDRRLLGPCRPQRVAGVGAEARRADQAGVRRARRGPGARRHGQPPAGRGCARGPRSGAG